MERKWLTEYREKQGLQKYQVAALAGISRSYYSNIESGIRKAPGDVALKISIVLGCPMELFYEELIKDWLEEWHGREVGKDAVTS